jgi:hypothetical protein
MCGGNQRLVFLLLPAQPFVRCNVRRTLWRGVEPRVDGRKQLGVAPQSQRKAEFGESEVHPSKQLP